MMNQYHHSQPYTTFPSHQHHHHFHSNNTTPTVFQTPSAHYHLFDENYVYSTFPPVKNPSTFYDSENSYEQYSIDNSTTAETIYHPISSFDQCHNYSNVNQQSYGDFSLSNNPTHTLEQSPIERKPIITDTKYKWMQIKRTPAKASGIT